MSAINALTLSHIAFCSRADCDCVRDWVRDRADTHVPVTRVPVVSARWTMETNGDGSRRLVERWSINQETRKQEAPSKPGSSRAGSITAPGDRDHVPAAAKVGQY